MDSASIKAMSRRRETQGKEREPAGRLQEREREAQTDRREDLGLGAEGGKESSGCGGS